MKNLYFIIFLLLTIPDNIFSQEVAVAISLSVINKTKCDQYFAVMGGEFCDCKELPYTTYLMTIGPDEEKYYEYSTEFPNQNDPNYTYDTEIPKGIVMVRISDRPPYLHCPQNPEGGSIGQPCINLPQSIVYRVRDIGCNVCVGTKTEWILSQDCKGEALLVFTTL